MVKNVTNENFEQEVIKSEIPVLVDFSATWCGPCRMISPFLEQLADEHKDEISVVKIDVDESSDLATQYGVRNVPTVLMFKNGEIINKNVGGAPKSKFEEMIKSAL